MKEGDNIAAITFFVAKPPKKVQVTIFCNKAIEEGDGSCHLLLLCCNRTIEKDDGSLPLPSLLQ